MLVIRQITSWICWGAITNYQESLLCYIPWLPLFCPLIFSSFQKSSRELFILFSINGIRCGGMMLEDSWFQPLEFFFTSFACSLHYFSQKLSYS